MARLCAALWLLVAALLCAGAVHAEGENEIRIGIITDMSGIYADIAGQGSVVAAEMAIEDADGQALGRPIALVSADHQNKADIAAAIVNRWIDTQGVDAVFDTTNSAVALAVLEITRAKRRIMINSGAATSDLYGPACSPTGFTWVFDTYALAQGTGRAMVAAGGRTWFFLTADYAFGHALERDASTAIARAGGRVIGGLRAPLGTRDFSAYLLRAQASGADVIALANAGADTINAVKQAREWGIVQRGQRLAGLLLFLPDIHSLGLEQAEGLVLTTGFYWDLDEGTRAFSRRFAARMGRPPSMVHAGVYSSLRHYLKAVEAARTDAAAAVAEQIRALPVEDPLMGKGHVRPDGRMVHDLYLAEVKSPAEARYPWDYYRIRAVIPGSEAFRPMSEGGCPLVADLAARAGQ